MDRAEERRIELLKAAGFNAIRSAHNPLSPAMLDACDRLGMLVMDEAFDMWVRGKSPYDYALDFPQWWAADLESMVTKDYNHPSVIMYSLGNEIVEVGTPHGSRLARQMAEQVRRLDRSRLVTNGVNAALTVLDEFAEMTAGGGLNDLGDGMNRLGMGENATRRSAESSSVLDVLGLNYAEGRYAPDREQFPHRVIVGSETFPSQIGRLWPMVVDNPNVIGDFTWTGWDYLGEVGIGATVYAEDPDAVPSLEREFPYLTAWTGDLDITGHRRPVSYYREIVFGLRREPYLAVGRPERHDHTITLQSPWGWSDSVSSWTWPGFEGRPITVEVYADADEAALLLDGAEIARGPVGRTKPMLAEFETSYQPGQLVAIAYRDGAEVGRTSLTSASGELVVVASADRDRVARRRRRPRIHLDRDPGRPRHGGHQRRPSRHRGGLRRRGVGRDVQRQSQDDRTLRLRHLDDLRRPSARGRPAHRDRRDHRHRDQRGLGTGRGRTQRCRNWVDDPACRLICSFVRYLWKRSNLLSCWIPHRPRIAIVGSGSKTFIKEEGPVSAG